MCAIAPQQKTTMPLTTAPSTTLTMADLPPYGPIEIHSGSDRRDMASSFSLLPDPSRGDDFRSTLRTVRIFLRQSYHSKPGGRQDDGGFTRLTQLSRSRHV